MRAHSKVDQSIGAIQTVALNLLATGLGILLLAVPASAQQWRSSLWGHDYLLIEKEGQGEGSFLALPTEVRALLGSESVDYEAFTAAYLPAEGGAALARELDRSSLRYWREADRWERLAADLDQRRSQEKEWKEIGLTPKPIPGLYLARFAFPVRQEWLSALAGCGAEVEAVLDSATILLHAGSSAALSRCRALRYLAWLDPFLTTDRAEPALFLEEVGADPDTYALQLLPTRPLEAFLRSLPSDVEVIDSDLSTPASSPLLVVRADRADLARLLDESEHLLGLASLGEAAPSDERQGQILAGNHNGTAVTAPGYLTWLSNRGLSGTVNQQTVAVFDTGYDDGTAAGPHHADLENPHRYVDGTFYIGSSLADTGGHGTMVAGIVAGNGATGSGAADCQGFHFGTGIAPLAKLVPVKIFHYNSTGTVSNQCSSSGVSTNVSTLRSAFAFSRNTGGGQPKALLSNHSWNGGTGYDGRSLLFDEMVVDANSTLAGEQPMTVVVSAGNQGASIFSSGCPGSCSAAPVFDTVRPPATAKNVISVGATENYRPVSQVCQPPAACGCWCSALAQDANNINRLAHISSKGKYFERYDIGDPPLWQPQYAHNVRIKPDLVAPGVRITSTVPYMVPSFTCTNGLCSQFFPATPITYHSYAQGTSFAAPAVSGAAALLRKYLLDRGIDPAPSLLKAILVATADNLGTFSEYAGDHRPSHLYGWGRVNLNRATDGAVTKYYVNESAGLAVTTGVQRSFPVTVNNGARDIYVVLAWSDPPSTVSTSSQVPLLNDLRLTVSEGFGAPFWRGNNFMENKWGGIETGYSYRFALGGDPTLEDTINTVEAVFIPAGTFPSGKQLTLQVTGVSVMQGAQRFALYGYNVN